MPDLAEFCEFVIASLFEVAPTSTSLHQHNEPREGVDTPPYTPPPEGEASASSQRKEPPALVEFIVSRSLCHASSSGLCLWPVDLSTQPAYTSRRERPRGRSSIAVISVLTCLPPPPGIRSLPDSPTHLHRPPEPASALPPQAAIPISTRHIIITPPSVPQLAHALSKDQHGRHLLEQILGYRWEQLLPITRGEPDGARTIRLPRLECSSTEGRTRQLYRFCSS